MNEYKDAMDSLCPTDEQRERMFARAEQMAAEKSAPKKRRIKLRFFVIAAAAMLALAGTTTVFAHDIARIYHSFFKDDTIISDEIVENVYFDTDGHVNFYVNRIVSDTMHTYAIVQYTALDDIGRNWLYNVFFPLTDTRLDDNGEIVLLMGDLDIFPNGSAGNLKAGSCELTDFDTEDTRIFKLNVHADKVLSENDFVKIEYKLTDCEKRSANLHITETLQLYDASIIAEKSPDLWYVPTGVKYSSLGIMVYGDAASESEDYKKSPVCQLVRSDGSLIRGSSTWSSSGARRDVDGYDVVLYLSFFDEPADVGDVVGIRIDGKYYDLK